MIGLSFGGAFATLTAALLLTSVTIAGQTTASSPTTSQSNAAPPRTAAGKPDLQGVWNFANITPLERPEQFAGKEFLNDDEVKALEMAAAASLADPKPKPGDPGTYNEFWLDIGTKVAGNRRTSLIVDPPDGKLPSYTPQGERRRAERAAMTKRPPSGPEDLPLQDRCILGFNSGPPMIPGAYNNYVQIFQSSSYVVLLTEMVHDARIVPLDGRPHLSAHIRQWRGDSRGHWDGDTLVVETKNFRPEGTAHPLKAGGRLDAIGANLHLIERFTRRNADTLNYDFTVADSTTFARPWTGSYPMAKSRDQVYEYACHEGNYSMATILAGARAQEKAGNTRP